MLPVGLITDFVVGGVGHPGAVRWLAAMAWGVACLRLVDRLAASSASAALGIDVPIWTTRLLLRWLPCVSAVEFVLSKGLALPSGVGVAIVLGVLVSRHVKGIVAVVTQESAPQQMTPIRHVLWADIATSYARVLGDWPSIGPDWLLLSAAPMSTPLSLAMVLGRILLATSPFLWRLRQCWQDLAYMLVAGTGDKKARALVALNIVKYAVGTVVVAYGVLHIASYSLAVGYALYAALWDVVVDWDARQEELPIGASASVLNAALRLVPVGLMHVAGRGSFGQADGWLLTAAVAVEIGRRLLLWLPMRMRALQRQPLIGSAAIELKV